MTFGRYKVHLFRRGRSAGSFLVVLFLPRERRTEECPTGFTGLLLPPEKRAERPFSLLFSLPGPPPIALAISYCSSSSQPRVRGQGGLSGRLAPIRITLRSLSLLPDLERYYESSVPDSIAAVVWFTGTTKKSHAYVTVIDGLSWTTKTPVVLLVSIPIIILMINHLVLCHKNLESVSWRR
ncbi:hypothetical protein GBA52_009452 [Prunus armeniaca]|nr:hypothetical protein GBA52_009452 [Prunus armeniaca]